MASLTPPIEFADADVFHARLGPNGLRFRYRVLALFVDIDRAHEPHGIPLFGFSHWHLFGFDPKDHGARGASLRTHIDALHRSAQLPRPATVTLVCFPRILGFVFNPISTFVCRDQSGRMTSVVYEVRNTFGERHTYVMPVRERPDRTIAPHECDKLFYVSPFMDMGLRYRFLVVPPRQGAFCLTIIERGGNGVVLTALMRAKSFLPTRLRLLARLAATPLAGFKVIAGIHTQALRLWLKGHRIRLRPPAPAEWSFGEPGQFTLPPTKNSGTNNA